MDDTMLDGLDPNDHLTDPPNEPPTPAPADQVARSLQSIIRNAMCDNADDFSVQPALFAWTIACRHCGWQLLAGGPDLSRTELHLLREHRLKHAEAMHRHDRCTAPCAFTCQHRLPRLPDEFAG